ncbi:HNH endonuclease [Mycobacterium sp. NBC_00419]|uniref:HNH endonuclease signature motif containing protein n=1 Tax=Mycobacterium sp. NBC_00419 TaxID=2975989 RepID=UPI002E1F0195
MFDSPFHDYWEPPVSAASEDLIARLCGASRAENRAGASRLRAVCELFEMRRVQRGERADWAVDTWAAVGAEVAAALRVSLAKAGSLMNYGLAMLRLPAVAAVFEAGDIDVGVFAAIVFRTELITDESAMAAVDAELAARVGRWPSMTRGRLNSEIDRVVVRHDRDAVRRVRERAQERHVSVWDKGDGTAELDGVLVSSDAAALDTRLDGLAGTVCGDDPRTVEQRRADALGALAVGMDRLACRCGNPDCPAGERPANQGVVIHVVAEQATVEGRSQAPGYLMGTNALISAELVAELARTAKQRPLFDFTGSPAEAGYRPSQGLADFVRARDLTCRAPGCDRPATDCDLDHTIPYPLGPTHAGNLKCLCRVHHLLKTFWGWRDEQLPDGTVIWRIPGGSTYITTPGSVFLFPTLVAPTPSRHQGGHREACEPGEQRGVMMPRRTRTRAQNRAHAITTERTRNHNDRRTRHAAILGTPPPDNDADPPPF